jgi:hypothetical protein
MGLKTIALAGAVLATMTIGSAAPAFAATQAAPQAASQAVPPLEQSVRTMAAFPGTSGQQDDESDDISGLNSESPVCSALGAETIPTGDTVANCTSGMTNE